MPKCAPLVTHVEWDDDAWSWSVSIADSPDYDGETLESGREETEEAAREAAEDALAELEDAAAEREHDRHLRWWYSTGRSL